VDLSEGHMDQSHLGPIRPLFRLKLSSIKGKAVWWLPLLAGILCVVAVAAVIERRKHDE
jgi:hypothetical protein